MKLSTRLLGMVATGALAGCTLLAQGPMGRGARGMAMGGAASQELLATYLGLTDAQKAEAATIFANAKTAAQPIQTQLQTAQANLTAAIKAGQPVDTLAAAEGALQGQLIAIRAKAQEQFRAILTPDQLAKLDQFQAKVRTRGAGAPSNP